jgi:hypothetical protein
MWERQEGRRKSVAPPNFPAAAPRFSSPLSQKKREKELEGNEDEKRGAPTEPAHLYSRQIGIFLFAHRD